MPPKRTSKEHRRLHLLREASQVEELKQHGADSLWEEIDYATSNPYKATETTFKSLVLAYVGHPSPEQGSSSASNESGDDAADSALDIDWSLEGQQLLEEAKQENPTILDLVQTHFGLYKTCFRFMHCLPSDVVGPNTYLEFDSSLTVNTRWTLHFCERLGELVPQPLFRGSPVKLALAIQWTVIYRTKDRRKYRLSGCKDDGFLQCLTATIAVAQDGTKYCTKLREVAAELYRERFPNERSAEPLWCQLFRIIEELAFPVGQPDEEAPDAWEDPYFVHTEDLTTVCKALDEMRHLSFRMFTDTETVYTAAAITRRQNDVPLKPEANKAWEAHLIVWQRGKASRGTQARASRTLAEPDVNIGVHADHPSDPSPQASELVAQSAEPAERRSELPSSAPTHWKEEEDAGVDASFGDKGPSNDGFAMYKEDNDLSTGEPSQIPSSLPRNTTEKSESLTPPPKETPVPMPTGRTTPQPAQRADRSASLTPRSNKRTSEKSPSVAPLLRKGRKRARYVIESSPEQANSLSPPESEMHTLQIPPLPATQKVSSSQTITESVKGDEPKVESP